jgi:flavin-dependent dehydrogenase
VTSTLVDLGDFPLAARNLVEDEVAWGYAPRRMTLDKILVDAAVESGAEFREGFHVDQYVFEDGALLGIRGRGASGSVVEERATITVGADGRNSRLARAVHAPIYNEAPTLLCYYFSYWSGVLAEDFELYVRSEQRRVIFSFKTEDGLFAVFVGLPAEQLGEVRRDIDAAFMRSLDQIPEFAARVRAGRREERFYGASDLPNFYRRPYGPGWALAGDAGLHKDPFLALGICDALRDVEILADAIGEGLASKRPMHDALVDYEHRRNEHSAVDYKENLAEASFRPASPQVLALRAAVKDKPEEATRLIKARMGMTNPAEFFNPENLQRLLGGPTTV